MAEVTLSSNEFKALSSDIRVHIIKSLKERNYTLTELAKKMNMSSPSMKQHLGVLVSSGLIQQVDEGRKWKYYCLTRKGEKIVAGRESDTTILIVLGISSIAMVAVLLVLFGSIASISTQLSKEGAAVGEIPIYNAPAAGESAQELENVSSIPADTVDRERTEFGPITQTLDLILVYASVAIALLLATIIGFLIAKFYMKR